MSNNNIYKEIVIVVPGIPQGKGAARHSRVGFTYTPTKTRSYMAEIKEFAIRVGAVPLENPCCMFIEAYFPVPSSYSKKKAAAALSGKLSYTKKPDTDNLSKIKDGLNGVAFKDDAQVFMEMIHKAYSSTPMLKITITYFLPWDSSNKRASSVPLQQKEPTSAPLAVAI